MKIWSVINTTLRPNSLSSGMSYLIFDIDVFKSTIYVSSRTRAILLTSSTYNSELR